MARYVTVLTLWALLVIAGCSRPSVKADGSSTVFPVTEAVAEEFANEHSGIRVVVGRSGTGGGFKKFSHGEIDICNASRPITDIEKQACRDAGIEYIELEIAYDGLAVCVNSQNDWCTCLTVDQLKTIWQPDSKVSTWSEIDPNWPDAEIELFGADTDSGTFDYFTEVIVGHSGKSRSDYHQSADDNTLDGKRAAFAWLARDADAAAERLADAIAELDRAYTVLQSSYNRLAASEDQLGAVQAAYEADKAPLDLLLEAQRRRSESAVDYTQNRTRYAVATKNVHFVKGTLLDYDGVYLAEGPWPTAAYHDAAEREASRSAPQPLNYASALAPVVSRGPHAQHVDEALPDHDNAVKTADMPLEETLPLESRHVE